MKLGLIAEALGLTASGGGDIEISNAAPLDTAGPSDISFALNNRSAAAIAASRAGALVLPKGSTVDRPAIIADNPLYVFAMVMDMLHPEKAAAPSIHPTAVIGMDVKIGEGVFIGPHASIGDGSELAEGVSVMAGARVGANCVVGPGSKLFENVVVYGKTKIGARCRIHANTTIGSDGFGYTRLGSGKHHKVPQLGSVVIEDDVEIGANTSVDRGMLSATVIKSGTKIDNQVQIGHNSVIGRDVIIAGCSGVAGSSEIGDGVMIGGASAVSDHVKVSSGALVAGFTGVHTDLTEPGVYSGPLAMKNMEYKRFVLSGKRLDKVNERLKALEEKMGGKEGKNE
ncbi:MAG: UDP-3-O-(3-hydroxymyristoyl)glucosamine N-acyltransferase [Nitrospinae bacterium]|nr:UDP-3-O-(3-hydroxymyristoyl)glucosamine N-acyltransferase [Nitrospinota bacterium]